MNPQFTRSQLLIQQGRFDLAEQELRQSLAQNPEDESAHALLAICLTELGKHEAAVAEGRAAVGLAPDFGFCHYSLAFALYRRDAHASEQHTLISTRQEYREAESTLLEAIRLEPDAAHHFALLASIRLARRDWNGALEAAHQGLQLDPMDVECTNARATALVKLGRREEASQALDAALAEDPEDSRTHANKGWALLHAGKPKEALEHFKESLRIDPGNEYAQAGIVEALKARNFVYRGMLAYFLWMSRLSATAQWGIVLGGYFGMKILATAGRSNPGLQPYIFPLQILYLLFAILTWTAPHLFNLLLRLDRYGRYTLSSDQILGANCVGACVLSGLILGGMAFAFDSGLLLLCGLGAVALMIPVGGTFTREGRARKVLGLYTLGLVLLGLGSVGLTLAHSPAAGTLGMGYVIGLILFGWIANLMGTR